MKDYKLNIVEHQIGWFFTPIRNQIDFVKIILRASSLLLLGYSPKKTTQCNLRLFVKGNSRLYLSNSDKVFSISFPFHSIMSNNEITRLTSPNGTLINDEIISNSLSILTDKDFINSPYTSSFSLGSDDYEPGALNLIEELLMCEASYIRFDRDPMRKDEVFHPLNHLDINYSSRGTYKVGLENVISDNDMIEIIEPDKPCKYLKMH